MGDETFGRAARTVLVDLHNLRDEFTVPIGGRVTATLRVPTTEWGVFAMLEQTFAYRTVDERDKIFADLEQRHPGAKEAIRAIAR